MAAWTEDTPLTVGDLRREMEGLPDDAQAFVDGNPDRPIVGALHSKQIPHDRLDAWQSGDPQVIGLELWLGGDDEFPPPRCVHAAQDPRRASLPDDLPEQLATAKRAALYHLRSAADLRAERDALAATVQRVRALCDDPWTATHRGELARYQEGVTRRGAVRHGEFVNVDDLRTTLDTAPSDPATDTGGEAT